MFIGDSRDNFCDRNLVKQGLFNTSTIVNDPTDAKTSFKVGLPTTANKANTTTTTKHDDGGDGSDGDDDGDGNKTKTNRVDTRRRQAKQQHVTAVPRTTADYDNDAVRNDDETVHTRRRPRRATTTLNSTTT